MFNTSLDSLYSVLALSIMLVTVFLCVAITYLILILRDVSKVTHTVKKTAYKIDKWVIEPAKIINEVRKKVALVSEYFGERAEKKRKKRG